MVATRHAPHQQPTPKWGVGLRKVARGTAAHRRSRSALSLDTRGWSKHSPANDHPKTACQDVTAVDYTAEYGQIRRLLDKKDSVAQLLSKRTRNDRRRLDPEAMRERDAEVARLRRSEVPATTVGEFGARRGGRKPHVCLDSMGWPCSSCWSRFIQRGEEQFVCQQLQRRGDRDRYERADNPQQRRPDQDGDHGDAAGHFYGASNDLGHQ